jgi:sodium-dependent dicarboxylate transporter 2/3/5
VTSLLPIILMPLTGAAKIEETTRAYADPMIFLFVGGFIMAIAMEKWNLHRRIALNILKLLGTKSDRIVLGFILATGSISMWISNTATAAMMLPTGIALISQIPDDLSGGQQKANFAKAIMLSIAYAASIGGVATLVGTPTNVIFAGMVKDLIGVEVSFVKWMAFGIPSVVILLFLCWLLLTKFLFPLKNYTLPGSHSEIKKQLQELGKMSWEEKWILAVFSVVAFAWITRSYLLKSIVPGLDDPMIALLGAIALFLIPSKSKPGAMLLDWKSAERLSWGILFLYGGGLALAEGFKISGLSDWLGTQLTYLSGMPYWAILLIVMFFVVALTEIASNVATVAMMMPILGALGQALHLDPFGLMVAATIAASCGFMMPAGTAPNAIVFGSGHLRIVDMVKAGFWLDVLAALFFAGVAYWIVPLLWG